MNPIVTTPAVITSRYLNAALDRLNRVGIQLNKVATSQLPIKLLEGLKGDEATDSDLVIIAKTLDYQEAFAALVREKTATTVISDTHLQLTGLFNSIKRDVLRCQGLESKETISFIDKSSMWWMKASRGTIPARFSVIERKYFDVITETGHALDVEDAIINAYLDIRGALQSSQIAAHRIWKAKSVNLESRKQVAIEAAAFASEGNIDNEERARRGLLRDEAQRNFEVVEDQVDNAKRITENLLIAYNLSEAVVAALNKAHQAKKKVNQQSIIFFSTNKCLFTALEANFVAQMGLRTATKTQQAINDGINGAIELSATLLKTNNMEAIKVAHGPTVKAESFKLLLDAIEAYELGMVKLTQEARQEATVNSNLIAQQSSEAKARMAVILDKNIQLTTTTVPELPMPEGTVSATAEVAA